MTLIEHTDKIWTIMNFLSLKDCRHLIAQSEEKSYQEATVSLPGGARMMKGLRDNYRQTFEDSHYAQSLFDKLHPYLPMIDKTWHPARLNERFRFYRYDVDQRFKRHIDGRVKAHGLESRLTVMVYLNSGFKGGETKFDNVTILPKTGTCLLFVHEQKHESLPIQAGQKYVLRSDVLYKNTDARDSL
ncbi:2OG-Fe(II) oxygenase [Hellea sp.]|nr:2OG-Fe(II) oxygenase [Hellea sp.]MDA8708614.1 2OG-Fe(II) oxygenase [Hellea sp.]